MGNLYETTPIYKTNGFKIGLGVAIVTGAAVGSAIGVVSGGLIGGITAETKGGNFIDGFAEGMLVGANGVTDSAIYAGETAYRGGEIKAQGLAVSFLTGAVLSGVTRISVGKYGKSQRIESGSNAKLDYVTSNGLVLETTPNKTTTVLGTYKSDTGAILDELGNVKSLDFGPRDGGFNLLNTPDELYVSSNQFWNEYNKPWLDNAITRNDIFKIATEPTWDNLTRVNIFTGKTELTGFGREYTYLKQHGYYLDAVTKTMVK